MTVRTIKFGTKKEFILLEQMLRTPAKCIFKKGDLVKFSEIGKRNLSYRRVNNRRLIAVVEGFSRTWDWCIRVRWIMGYPKPIKNVERYAWVFFDFAEEHVTERTLEELGRR